ncbi:MAG: universal stress protein [Nitrospirae bacterium]|nr:universal stress protein [Nitrospirota bacterium]
MHLMLALDESRYADAILTWMRRFPHQVGTRLTLVHVMEPRDVPEGIGARDRVALQRQQQAGARALLARAARSLRKPYSEIKVVVREGLPIYEVLRMIREMQPDMVVSGTRGLLGAKGLALGSLSQRLLNYAPCSVMLIPAKIKPANGMRVMLATDGSRGAKRAARFLAVLPDLEEVIVMTAVRPVDARELAMHAAALQKAPRTLRAQVSRARRATASRAIEETVDVLRPSGVAVQTRIATGHPAEAIPRLAKQDGCDMLVIGSRGLTGMTAMALGSVSLAVAQCAPCPVMVVKKLV